MDFFKEWCLEPNLQIALISRQVFFTQFERSNSLKLKVCFEREEPSSEDDVLHLARTIAGSLKTKIIYPAGDGFFYGVLLLPKLSLKTLNGENVGRPFIAAYLGAEISKILHDNSALLEGKQNICLHLSEGIREHLEGEEREFILGLLQRSLSNKITKKPCPTALFLLENQFSQEMLDRAISLADGMGITRSLINMPPNALNPETYEAIVRSLVAAENKRVHNSHLIQVEVFDMERLKRENCNLICAVGEGGQHPPRLIKLSYAPTLPSDRGIKTVALVGKGITFDSGGLDIKPSTGMRNMKKDMGGSAAVLGTFLACVRLGVPLHLHCFLAVAENMVSAEAMRPGDIYRARNGLAVEIDNTDCEGRLVLADTLSLASDLRPDWIIDVATLTGAARVALGPQVDALYGSEEVTSSLLFRIGQETGDWFWPMPLVEDYNVFFDSSIADLANGSGGTAHGGSITGALFLKRFVGVKRWNHIDSFMWADRAHFLWGSSGPTAKCVRALVRSLEEFAG